MIVVGLIAACVAIYGQVIWFDFINFDDNLYVYENPFVLAGISPKSLQWAFTTFHSANWHPLTWISHMADATFFGRSPGAHHVVNVVFHTINSILAFVVFRRMTGDVWKSAIVAFLFAVHPAHVESVAWVSERKDVLSTMFWLLTMLFYVHYASRADGAPLQRILSARYLVVVICFALGLAAKPMLVTLPFVLLLCDYWPLERLKTRTDLMPLVLEKLPLFLLAAVSAYITVLAQASYGAIQSTAVLPLDTRALNAVISYAKYIGMLFYPVDLGVGYAYQFPFPTWQVAVSIATLVLLTALCIWQLRDRKYLLVGWLWFLGTMVPVVGLVQVGAQSMADRYTYVPYFGLFLMLVWGVSDLALPLRLKFAAGAAIATVPIAIFIVLAFFQTTHWRNSLTLYAHTLSAGQGNFLTMSNFCTVLLEQDRLDEAEAQCRNSIAADPGLPEAHVLLGVINLRKGRNEESIQNFQEALKIDPDNALAHGNLAAPFALTGRIDEAEATLARAVQAYRRAGSNPAVVALSYSNLASEFAKQNRLDKAEAVLRTALDLAPNRADLRANLALALTFQRKLTDARREAEMAAAQSPDLAEAQNVLGIVLMEQGEKEAAAMRFRRALELKPGFAEAKSNLDRLAPDGTR